MEYKKYLSALILSFYVFSSYATIISISTTPNNTFSPASVSANVGDTIRWTGQGGHTTSSTTIPNNATSWDWDFNSGSTFDYVITVAGTYNYKCTPHGLMGMTGTITVANPPVGIAKRTQASFNYYPNPFQKYLVLNFKNYSNSVNVEIYDILGKQYFSNKYIDVKDNKVVVDTDEFNPGVYFIYITTNGKKDVYRIMKNSVSAS